ncbi:MAG: hypothetical protein RMA76_21190 [Deltaproteobacteria bacterium]|jgi:hypothetical protein
MRAALTLGLLCFGCASTQGRAYQRKGLAKLPKQSVALFVAAAPATESGEHFRVESPGPVERETTLALDATDPAMTAALASAVVKQLEAKGYAVTPFEGPTIAGAEADLVIVVRVQPVDRFYVSKQTVYDLQAARQGATSKKPPLEPRQGRLLVGQAYVFDAKTGLRLWSRDAVDFPSEAWLNPDSALLEYGVVGPHDDLANASAAAFTAKTFAKFPGATEGDASTRAKLDAIDVEQDEKMLAAVDRTKVLVGVDASWGFDGIGARVEGAGEGVRIDTNALAPSGTFRFTPHLDARFPGGVTIGVGVPIGFAPGSYSEVFVNGDRAVEVAFSSPEYLGVQLGVRYDRYSSSDFHIRPGGGLFIDGWRIGADPRGTIEGDAITRYGLFAELFGLLDVTEVVHVLGGVRGRVGPVVNDRVALGIEVAIGAGLSL